MNESADIVVIGAGAAGLWAAGVAARLGRDVLVLEKTPRTGSKVLASGGTRCNLTTTLDGPGAARLFGRAGERFLSVGFRVLPPRAVRERFSHLGVDTIEAPLEKVFPASGRAKDVRDALEREARDAGARIRCSAGVERLEPHDGAWVLHLVDGSVVRAARVIVSSGGASYPRTGTTGDGYRWLAELALEIVEPVPALVPLVSPAAWARALTGIALQEVEAVLVDENGLELARRRRPVLFTHQGLSGPGAMDLSEPVARRAARAAFGNERAWSFALRLDLFPTIAHEALRAHFIAAAARPGGPTLSRSLPAPLPARLLAEITRLAGLDTSDPRLSTLDRAARHRLVETLKALPVPVNGTLGMDHAEVTAGGLALAEVDSGTMRVKKHAGLYVCGELLDLQGPIGGLNFQSAFSTAELAARHAAIG